MFIQILFYLFLTTVIISVTHKLASSGKKSSYYWLGSGGIILSGVPVLIYFFMGQPLPPEKYCVADIEYTACYLEGDKGDRSVILDAGSKKFSIYYWLWHKEYHEKDVIDMLSKSSQARIWLKSKNDTKIKGIRSTYFRIDPSKGYEWDKSNRKSLLWIGAGLLLWGLLVIVYARFSGIPTRRI
jgi:hypothetical protein